MVSDRAGNTLASARRLGTLNSGGPNSGGLALEDRIGGTDRNDLFVFRLGNRSRLQLNPSRIRAGSGVVAELFSLKGSSLPRRIGRTEFSSLRPAAIRANLNRIGRQALRSGAAFESVLDAGEYYLRVSGSRLQTPYKLKFAPQAISGGSGVLPGPVLPGPVLPGPTLPAATVLYNGQGLPKSQSWLDLQQAPIRISPLQLPFVPSSFQPLVSTTVQSAAANELAGANGVTLNTEIFTGQSTGYVGYTNYTVNVASALLNPLSPPTPGLVNASFPTLNRTTGFTLSFKLALSFETSAVNRAGFSVVLLGSDAKGIELGFKSDRIFAQSATLTEAESVTPAFSLSSLTDYRLTVQGEGYKLFANNSQILSGSLHNYQFNPATSSPPLPANPYTVSNLLFLGDNTDQGRATFTLGAVSIG